MNVNFNNLRAQAAYALDDLTKKLNDSKLPESEWKEVNGKWISGDMLIDSKEIQKHMDDLRMLILTINAVYEPDNDDFKDMSDDIDKNGGVAFFNEERE